jgi:hypothetical protein
MADAWAMTSSAVRATPGFIGKPPARKALATQLLLLLKITW